jgi:hypothetical protein
MQPKFRIAIGTFASVSALALILPTVPPAFADAPGSGDPGIARISDVARTSTGRVPRPRTLP